MRRPREFRISDIGALLKYAYVSGLGRQYLNKQEKKVSRLKFFMAGGWSGGLV